MLVVEAVAAPAPEFDVVSPTLIVAPAAPSLGAVSAATTRSGPIAIARAVALLPSALSGTAPPASARAMRYWVPAGVPAGMVTVVVPVLVPLGASAGTD